MKKESKQSPKTNGSKASKSTDLTAEKSKFDADNPDFLLVSLAAQITGLNGENSDCVPAYFPEAERLLALASAFRTRGISVLYRGLQSFRSIEILHAEVYLGHPWGMDDFIRCVAENRGSKTFPKWVLEWLTQAEKVPDGIGLAAALLSGRLPAQRGVDLAREHATWAARKHAARTANARELAQTPAAKAKRAATLAKSKAARLKKK